MSGIYASYPFIGSGGSGGVMAYANLAAFPSSGNTVGQVGIAQDTLNIYAWNGSIWVLDASPTSALSLGNLDAQSPTAQGAALVAGVLSMQSATATAPGLVNTTTQSFAGQKTFSTGLTGTLTGSASLNVLTSALGNLTESTSDVLTISGGTGGVVGNVSIDVKKATTSQDGYLSSTDWNTFNSKQAAGNYANQNLSNLTAYTAINVDLLPATSGVQNLGTSTDPWGSVKSLVFDVVDIYGDINGSISQLTGSIINFAAVFPSFNASLTTVNNTIGGFGSGASGNISVVTGNAPGGNSGNISLQTGTASGTRGAIQLQNGSQGTAGQVWTSTDTNGSGSWAAGNTAPTSQVLTASSGTYTLPTGVKWIKVTLVGSGAGGEGGGGIGSTYGTNGGNTTFGTSFLVANGGLGQSGSIVQGGSLTPMSGSFTLIVTPGIVGGSVSGNGYIQGYIGSGGSGGGSSPVTGGNGLANSGAGGGGGGGTYQGQGGGSGEMVTATIFTPNSTYAYTIGAGGTGGSPASGGGGTGGVGGTGIIIVQEYYQ